MRSDISAADTPMIRCGVSATVSVGEWDWRRYLEFVLDGLRVGAPASSLGSSPQPARWESLGPIRPVIGSPLSSVSCGLHSEQR
jgi:hypothetical protein